VMLEGAAVRVARALWCEHAGAAAGCPARCCLRVLLSQCALWRGEWRVRFGACLLVPVQGAAAGCRCRVLLQDAVLSEWPVRFGGGLVVPLQAAAVGVACALWSWPASAASRCRCRVGVQGTTVKGLSAS
jgi:hypothetical protein